MLDICELHSVILFDTQATCRLRYKIITCHVSNAYASHRLAKRPAIPVIIFIHSTKTFSISVYEVRSIIRLIFSSTVRSRFSAKVANGLSVNGLPQRLDTVDDHFCGNLWHFLPVCIAGKEPADCKWKLILIYQQFHAELSQSFNCYPRR